MVRSFRFIIRLSLVALIFFSLQGEVIMRYAQIFHGKTEQQDKRYKRNAERQRLVKLQCFTQKFYPLALPGITHQFVFTNIPLPVLNIKPYGVNVCCWQAISLTTPLLRGPPVQA